MNFNPPQHKRLLLTTAQVKPIGAWVLIRPINQGISSIIHLPDTAKKRNMMSSLVSAGPNCRLPIQAGDVVFCQWLFQTEKDVALLSDGTILTSSSRLKGKCVGLGTARTLIPFGATYLVERIRRDVHKDDSGLWVGGDANSLFVSIYRSGLPYDSGWKVRKLRRKDQSETENPVTNTTHLKPLLEPGTVCRLQRWKQDHYEIMIDGKYYLVVHEDDLIYAEEV